MLRTISALDVDGEPNHEHKKSITDRPAFANTGKRHSNRPNAVIIAEKIDAPEGRKALIINLAAQFEHKSFLPTIGDVRNFLKMRGQDAGSIRQRPEAARKIIRALVDLSDENLEKVVRSSENSGPSQLGPLSDAIKAASASVRSRNTILTTTEQEARNNSSDASLKPLKSESSDSQNS